MEHKCIRWKGWQDGTQRKVKKAGFGAFYFDRDYYSGTGIPYYNVRRAYTNC
jgi:hypothetical protein